MRQIAREYKTTIGLHGKVDKSLERAMKAAQSKAAKTAQKIGTTFKRAAKASALAVAAGAVAMTTAFAGFGVDAVKSAASFQTEMQTVATLLDGTAEQVKGRTSELSEDVLKLSNDTGIAREELSAGLYDVISAVGDTEDSVKILEIAAKAAAAGQAETSESVSLLTAVTKGYGDTSLEAFNKASDLAFQTVKLGQTTFPELASSIGEVTGLASDLGVTQEELFGVYATLTGVTGNAAQVTTQYKAVLNGLMSPSKDMQNALEEIGYSTATAALESEGFIGVLDALMGTVDGDTQKMAKLFSQTTAQTAILALCGSQAENLTKKTEAMNNAMGATETAFETQTDTLEHTLSSLKNLWDNFKTSVGMKLLPVVHKIAQNLFPKIEAAMEKMAPMVSDVYTQLEPVLEKLGDAAEKALPDIMDGIGIILPEIARMMPTAIDAMMEILSLIGKLAPEVQPFISTVVNDLIPVAIDAGKGFMDAIGPGLETIAPLAQEIWETASGFATEVLPPLAEKLGEVVGFVLEIVGTNTDWEALQVTIGLIGAAFAAWKIVSVAKKASVGIGILKAGINALWLAKLKDKAETAYILALYAKDTIAKGASTAATIAQTAATTIWNGVCGLATIATTALGAAFTFLTSPIGLIIIAIGLLVAAGVILYRNWDTVKAKALELWEKLKGFGAYIANGFKEGWNAFTGMLEQTTAFQVIRDYVQMLIDVFKNIIEFIKNVFTGDWEAAWQNIVNIFTSIFEGVKKIAADVINGVIRVINGIIGGINKVAGKTNGVVPQLPELSPVAFERGGTVTSPTFALIGEGTDAETVVPHNNKPRSRALLKEAAAGVYGRSGGGSRKGDVIYAPVIYANNKDGVKEVLDEDFRRFRAFTEKMQDEDDREVFA